MALEVSGNVFTIYNSGQKIIEVFIPLDQIPSFKSGGVVLTLSKGFLVDSINVTGDILPIDIPTSTLTTPLSITETPVSGVATISPQHVDLPFVDKFSNNSIDSHWKISGYPPVIVNGELLSKGDLWMFIGDETWKNYQVNVTVGGSKCSSDWTHIINGNMGGFHTDQALHNFVALVWNTCHVEWAVYSLDGPSPFTGQLTWLDPKLTYFEVEVRDSVYTLYVNNRKHIQYKNTDFVRGGVALKLVAETTIKGIEIIPLDP